jgi:predicted Zn-dependent peptidase
MTVVVSGEIPEERLLGAFERLGAPRGAAQRPRGGTAPPTGRQDTQVYRHWYGEAYRVADPLDPHARVAAVLAAERLREARAGFDYASVELWELQGMQVIATIAAEYTAGAAAMRQGFPGLIVETRQSLDDEDVEAAVRQVGQDLLERARSPVGLVSVVGRWLDAGGDAGSAREYLDALGRVSPESMRAFLGTLERQTPLRVEVRP